MHLVADARLDDRAGLRAALHDGAEPATEAASDAELILAAYLLWGEHCPARLLGDFAFVLWDARRHRLFAARDPIGLRTLCYMQQGDDLYLASSVEELLGSLSAPQLNRPFLADFLDRHYERWVDETPFAGIHRLPQAHCMTVKGGQMELRRYWTLGAQGAERFARPEAYGERFRELLDLALADRLAGPEPKALMVSGGLDSSSLACLCHRLAQEGRLAATVGLYSAVFPNTPSADESSFLDSVTRSCPTFAATALESDDCWAFSEVGADAGYPFVELETETTRAHITRLLRRLRDDGHRVVVTGLGADQLLGSDGYWVLKALLEVPWRRVWSESAHFRSPWPRSARAAAAVLGRRVPRSAWRRRELWHRWGGRPGRDLLAAPPLASGLSERCHTLLTHGLASAGWTQLAEMSRWLSVEFRHPYLDRRLVDFALNLPLEQRIQGGWNKVVLRSAMRGVLPEAVRQRRGGAHLGDLAASGTQGQGYGRILELFEAPLLVDAGFVQQPLMAEFRRRLRGGERESLFLRQVAVYSSAELWLRHHRKRLGFRTGA